MPHRFEENTRALTDRQLMTSIRCMEAAYEPGSTKVSVELPLKLTFYYIVAEERRLITPVVNSY